MDDGNKLLTQSNGNVHVISGQQQHQPYPNENPGNPPLPLGGNSSFLPTIGFVQQPSPQQHQLKIHTKYEQYIDPEDPLRPEIKGFDFSEASIRRGFIRKVYSILSIQLAITLGFIFVVAYEENTREFMTNSLGLLYAMIAVLFITLIVIVCVESARRKFPLNLIFLGIFTLAQSYFVGICTLRYDRDDVLLAIGFTMIVVIGLTMFAFQTKWDFTMMGGILFVGFIILLLFSLILMCMPGKTIILIYSSIGALLFSIYIIYDTQLIMGGTHKYSISPEEYIFASLTLYLDIINLFVHILRIIGFAKH